MNFDSIDTDTLTVQDGELSKLIDLIPPDGKVSCRRIHVETDQGTVEIDPVAVGLTISRADESDP